MDLIKKAEWQLVGFALAFCTLCVGLSFFLGKPFARLFISLSSSTPNERAITISNQTISIYMYGVIPLALQYVFVDGLTGMGQAKYSIWLSLNRKFILLLPLTILLPILSKNAFLVFYAEPIADILASLISTIAYFLLRPRVFRKRLEQTGNILD